MSRITPVSFKNVSFAFKNNLVLEDVSFELEEKDFVAIVGPNGGGKTTLVKLMLGLLEVDKGEVRILNEKPTKVSQKIGYVPQFSSFNKQYPITVKEVVLSGSLHSKSILPYYSKDDKERAKRLLEEMKITALGNNQVNELSGGQMQRMLIARAMMTNPDILILDEPTASVDIAMEIDIFDLLHNLNKDKTILVVSHDVNFVSTFANKVICLNRKLVIHSTSELTKSDSNTEPRTTEIFHHCHL